MKRQYFFESYNWKGNDGLNAIVIKGALKPGDDIEELGWFKISEELPEIAFDADGYLIEYLEEWKKRSDIVNVSCLYLAFQDKKE